MSDEGQSNGAPQPAEPEKPDDRGRPQDSGQPSQTEQSDQSGGGTESPPSEELPDYPDAEFVRNVGRPYITAGQAIGVRHEGTVHGGSYGFVHTLNQNIVAPSASGTPIAVAVDPKLLDKVRDVVVPPSTAERAMRILQERRVLLLQGRTHWGKATLALWLLSRVGGHDAGPTPGVCAISPDVRLDDLPEEFFKERAGDRYVIDTLNCEAAKALRLPVLCALCDQLGGGYLIITVDSRTPIPRIELHDYLVNCEEVAESRAVLRENLRWRLDGQEPPDRLFALDWVQGEVAREPLPWHLDQLAEVLAAVVQQRMDEVDAKAAYADLGPQRVEEWFESHRDSPERCRMVAAAVLNGASYHDVADAAETLWTLLNPPEKKNKNDKKDKKEEDEDEDGQPLRPPDWNLASPRRHIAEDVGARIVTTTESTFLGPCPSEVLQLEDAGLQREVLEHIWSQHDVVRRTLLEWLDVLGRGGSLNVRGRAAAAVGALSRKDFGYLYRRLLFAWATASEVLARVSAAVALNVVADDRELAPQVHELLHRWISRYPGSRQAWTATAAYGYGVGERWPKSALRDLRVVVEDVPHHAWVASRSLANLCQAGKARTVLDAIAGWAAVDDPPEAAERVLHVFLRMLWASGDPNVLSAVSGGEHGDVPTVLRLAAEDEAVCLRVVGLWKQAFHRAQTREQAVDTLDHWITLADDGEAALQALDIVAPELLMGTAREQDELADVLRDWATDPRRQSTNACRYLQSIRQGVDR